MNHQTSESSDQPIQSSTIASYIHRFRTAPALDRSQRLHNQSNFWWLNNQPNVSSNQPIDQHHHPNTQTLSQLLSTDLVALALLPNHQPNDQSNNQTEHQSIRYLRDEQTSPTLPDELNLSGEHVRHEQPHRTVELPTKHVLEEPAHSVRHNESFDPRSEEEELHLMRRMARRFNLHGLQKALEPSDTHSFSQSNDRPSHHTSAQSLPPLIQPILQPIYFPVYSPLVMPADQSTVPSMSSSYHGMQLVQYPVNQPAVQHVGSSYQLPIRLDGTTSSIYAPPLAGTSIIQPNDVSHANPQAGQDSCDQLMHKTSCVREPFNPTVDNPTRPESVNRSHSHAVDQLKQQPNQLVPRTSGHEANSASLNLTNNQLSYEQPYEPAVQTTAGQSLDRSVFESSSQPTHRHPAIQHHMEHSDGSAHQRSANHSSNRYDDPSLYKMSRHSPHQSTSDLFIQSNSRTVHRSPRSTEQARDYIIAPDDQSIKQPADSQSFRAAHQSTNRSAAHLTRQPTDQSTYQTSSDYPANLAMNQSTCQADYGDLSLEDLLPDVSDEEVDQLDQSTNGSSNRSPINSNHQLTNHRSSMSPQHGAQSPNRSSNRYANHSPIRSVSAAIDYPITPSVPQLNSDPVSPDNHRHEGNTSSDRPPLRTPSKHSIYQSVNLPHNRSSPYVSSYDDSSYSAATHHTDETVRSVTERPVNDSTSRSLYQTPQQPAHPSPHRRVSPAIDHAYNQPYDQQVGSSYDISYSNTSTNIESPGPSTDTTSSPRYEHHLMKQSVEPSYLHQPDHALACHSASELLACPMQHLQTSQLINDPVNHSLQHTTIQPTQKSAPHSGARSSSYSEEIAGMLIDHNFDERFFDDLIHQSFDPSMYQSIDHIRLAIIKQRAIRSATIVKWME